MRVLVHLYGYLKDGFQKGTLEVSLHDNAKLRDLIEKIKRDYGKELGELLRPAHKERPPLMIMVGNKDYRFFGELDIPLEDNISVYFIPPAVGGM